MANWKLQDKNTYLKQRLVEALYEIKRLKKTIGSEVEKPLDAPKQG